MACFRGKLPSQCQMFKRPPAPTIRVGPRLRFLYSLAPIRSVACTRSPTRSSLPSKVRSKLFRGDLASVADPRFCGAYDVGSMWKVAETALECTASEAAERPVMSTVVSNLKEAIESGSSATVSERASPSEPLRGVYALSSGTDNETSVVYAAPSAR